MQSSSLSRAEALAAWKESKKKISETEKNASAKAPVSTRTTRATSAAVFVPAPVVEKKKGKEVVEVVSPSKIRVKSASAAPARKAAAVMASTSSAAARVPAANKKTARPATAPGFEIKDRLVRETEAAAAREAEEVASEKAARPCCAQPDCADPYHEAKVALQLGKIEYARGLFAEHLRVHPEVARSALFWVERARVEEAAELPKAVVQVYEDAKAAGAEPREELEAGISAYMRRPVVAKPSRASTSANIGVMGGQEEETVRASSSPAPPAVRVPSPAATQSSPGPHLPAAALLGGGSVSRESLAAAKVAHHQLFMLDQPQHKQRGLEDDADFAAVVAAVEAVPSDVDALAETLQLSEAGKSVLANTPFKPARKAAPAASSSTPFKSSPPFAAKLAQTPAAADDGVVKRASPLQRKVFTPKSLLKMATPGRVTAASRVAAVDDEDEGDANGGKDSAPSLPAAAEDYAEDEVAGSVVVLAKTRVPLSKQLNVGSSTAITPVRRGVRATPLRKPESGAAGISEILEEVNFAYTPNPALLQPQHSANNDDWLKPEDLDLGAEDDDDDGKDEDPDRVNVSLEAYLVESKVAKTPAAFSKTPVLSNKTPLRVPLDKTGHSAAKARLKVFEDADDEHDDGQAPPPPAATPATTPVAGPTTVRRSSRKSTTGGATASPLAQTPKNFLR